MSKTMQSKATPTPESTMETKKETAMRHRPLLALALMLAASLALPRAAHAGRGSSYGQIMGAIGTGNADVIISELERAERLPCGACVEPVMALLDSDDYRVREVAAWWFARRPAQKAELVDVATARLYADDPVLARNGADILGTFRMRAAIPALAYAAARTDLAPEARVAAIRAIGTIAHPDGFPALVKAMTDTDASVRTEAIRSYRAMRGTPDGAPLTALLADASVDVRREAAAAVGHFKNPGARAGLETILAGDSDELTRRNAAWSLGELGLGASRAALEQAASADASSLVRSVARASVRKLH
jgi:HEAT repeat protein